MSIQNNPQKIAVGKEHVIGLKDAYTSALKTIEESVVLGDSKIEEPIIEPFNNVVNEPVASLFTEEQNPSAANLIDEVVNNDVSIFDNPEIIAPEVNPDIQKSINEVTNPVISEVTNEDNSFETLMNDLTKEFEVYRKMAEEARVQMTQVFVKEEELSDLIEKIQNLQLENKKDVQPISVDEQIVSNPVTQNSADQPVDIFGMSDNIESNIFDSPQPHM